MLVLSRKYSQRIVLIHGTTGETIVIEQREIRKDTSRIGLTAGLHWQIARGDLLPINDVNHPDFGKDYA